MLLNWHYDMTLSIWKKAMQFYVLAAETPDWRADKSSDKYYRQIRDVYNTLNQYFEALLFWQNEPFFKMGDLDLVLKKLWQGAGSNFSYRLGGALLGAQHNGLKSEITQYIANSYINDLLKSWGQMLSSGEMLYGDFFNEIDIILPFASTEIIKNLQRRAILAIMKLFRKSQQEDGEEYEWVLQEEWQKYYSMQPEFIARSFLLELAKTFGTDFWEKISNLPSKWINEQEKIYQHVPQLMKDPEHIWTDKDIELLFRDLRYGAMTGEELKRVVEKANTKGRNHLRQFIYRNVDNEQMFMLDEDMHPLGSDYQAMAWPERVVPMKLSVLRGLDAEGKYAPIWEKIFEEFHVVPA